MSLYGALRSGVSGLFAQTQSMAMLSDNIANVNTNGYKLSAPRFSTLVTTAATNTRYSSGGVQSHVAREIDAQGLLKASTIATNVAIQGKGFFTVTDKLRKNDVTDGYDIGGRIYYTRAGEFKPDKEGNLVNAGGYYLTGWGRNENDDGYKETNVQTAFQGVNVAPQSAAPQPTQNLTLRTNLNQATKEGGTFKTDVQIFDRTGSLRTLTVIYKKEKEVNTWSISATINNGTFIDPDYNNDGTIAADNGTDAVDQDGKVLEAGVADNNHLEDGEITQASDDWGNAGKGTEKNPILIGTIVFDAEGKLKNVTSDNGGVAGGSIGVTDPSDTNANLQLLIDYDENVVVTPFRAGRDFVPKVLEVPALPARAAQAAVPADPNNLAGRAAITIPAIPARPARAAIPAVLEVPAVAAGPGRPAVPAVPGRPAVPAVAAIPEVPEIVIPAVPAGTAEPGYAAVVAVAAVAEIPEVAGLPEVPEIPEQLATPEDAVGLDINFGVSGTADGLYQYSGASLLNGYTQDGKKFGSLIGVSINKEGEVVAQFDNEDSRFLYKVPVTTFNNPNGLQSQTGNVYRKTNDSGFAIAHSSGEGGAGEITPNSLETSTVDLATEFTNMITTQRAYSANTKIITTADEMMEELLRTAR